MRIIRENFNKLGDICVKLSFYESPKGPVFPSLAGWGVGSMTLSEICQNHALSQPHTQLRKTHPTDTITIILHLLVLY